MAREQEHFSAEIVKRGPNAGSFYFSVKVRHSLPDFLGSVNLKYVKLDIKRGYSDASIEFQQRILKNSGIGDKSYTPRVIFQVDYKISLKDGREEAAMVMFGAVNQVFAAIKIRPKDISILNTTPSPASMVTNHFMLRHNIRSFNLGGMSYAAGIIAIGLTKDLLKAYPGSYALVVSTKAVRFYLGTKATTGICSFLIASSEWGLLQCCSLAPAGTDGEPSINSTRRDGGWGGHALKANVPLLLLLRDSQRLHFLVNKTAKPYNFDIRNHIENACVLTTSKKVLDEIHYNLELTEEQMEASWKTLDRFGNTSSSSVWYELSYLEWRRKINRGERVCQIALGLGFKCCSVVWNALGRPKQHSPSPWDVEE
ncbi:hypothetical protein FNV43_RR20011 [Rhamnella rubrinervis]|uniref:very-long-chain 3-oxoacyl-CoA synthase n=1 Tax=Rhamnella rubrinervis TaxID=2594499 RepID=A0A8K0DXX6_9ROSA|nr:hypothetical protein FNV43_RR20011 [Rhamnella rubrinervis]